MSEKEKIETVSWKDIQVVTTNDGREFFYFVTPSLEVFMNEEIEELESLIRNHYHLDDVAQDYMPVQNSKEYMRYKDDKKFMQYGYEVNAEFHSMECKRETFEKNSDESIEMLEQKLAYAKAMTYLPTDGGGH
jgi:hypothetical protein